MENSIIKEGSCSLLFMLLGVSECQEDHSTVHDKCSYPIGSTRQQTAFSWQNISSSTPTPSPLLLLFLASFPSSPSSAPPPSLPLLLSPSSPSLRPPLLPSSFPSPPPPHHQSMSRDSGGVEHNYLIYKRSIVCPPMYIDMSTITHLGQYCHCTLTNLLPCQYYSCHLK